LRRHAVALIPLAAQSTLGAIRVLSVPGALALVVQLDPGRQALQWRACGYERQQPGGLAASAGGGAVVNTWVT
jgi:hypothetical protein